MSGSGCGFFSFFFPLSLIKFLGDGFDNRIVSRTVGRDWIGKEWWASQ